MLRQRTVVEVDGAALGEPEQVPGQHHQVGDAEEVVEAVPRELGGQLPGALDAPEAASLGPLPRGPIRARDARDLVPESQEALAALHQERVATHENESHGESSFVANRAP